MTFDTLGVYDDDAKRIIAYTTAVKSAPGTSITNLKEDAEALSGGHVYLYTGEKFQDVSNMEYSDTPMDDLIYYAQNDNYYYILESMEESFNQAIKAYKASQSNQ